MGVKVTLDQTYDQDITVVGGITPDDPMSASYLFDVTIPAGQTFAETGYILQTGLSVNATVTIQSINPTTVTKNGVTYSTQGFAGNCGGPINASHVGSKHNQVVEFIDSYNFTGKTQEEQFLDDVLSYTANVVDASVAPPPPGIWGQVWACGQADPIGFTSYQTYDGVLNLLVQRGQISSTSRTFLNSIVSETENLDYADFTTRLNQLENSYNISSLPEGEKFIVQSALSVFRESAGYWNNYYGPEDLTFQIPESSQVQNSVYSLVADEYLSPDINASLIETSVKNDQSNSQVQKTFGWRCFWCVAKNDLKGAVLGFVAASCICAKIGVAQPHVCGAIGAVAFGAIYSWAAKVCPDVCTRCRKPSTGSYPSWICQLPFLYWP